MNKWVLLSALAVTVAGLVVGLVLSPSATLHRVFAVFLIWIITVVINWIGLGVMLSACALTFKQVKGRDQQARNAVALGMNNP
jgi:hypothetical protein